MIKEKLRKNLATALKRLGIADQDFAIESPTNENFGDFSTSVALKLTKILKKNPMMIAEEIVKNLAKDELIEKVEILQPGFINFWLKKEYLLKEMADFLQKKDSILKTDIYLKKKIMVEYTDPNPFKEFHIGHLYSNTVGESIARIYEAVGADVKRADYFGDVGMHVARSVWGLMTKMKKEKVSLKDLEKIPLSERIKYLGQAYALGTVSYEKDKNIAEEIKDINYLVYLCGQEYLKDNYHWKPQVDYKQYLRPQFIDQYKTIKEVYYAGKKWSLDYFENIYKKLGTKFDFYYPESIVGEFGMKIVKENLKKGYFERSKGAVVFNGEKYGLHTRVFINSLGLPTYEAKELGLAVKKYEDYPYDKSVIVVGNEIKEYFKVLHKALSITYPDLGKKTINICTGMVRLPEGKMSSRTGQVITVEWLLKEIKNHLKKIIGKGGKVNEDQLEEINEIVTIGAVKYSLLKANIGKDVIFDFKETLSLEGNSGPYLQYTYARCQSVLEKANPNPLTRELVNSLIINSDELFLLRTFAKYPDVVYSAASTLSPHLICNYLFDLAQKYNLFYQKNPILKAEKDVKDLRLLITKVTAQIIKNGLYLLGIKTVEKM